LSEDRDIQKRKQLERTKLKFSTYNFIKKRFYRYV